MDGISLHLPPVIPDSYYEISTHNSGYHPYTNTTNAPWTSRDDGARGYQPQGGEFEAHSLRFSTGNTGRQRCQMDTVEANLNGEAPTSAGLEQGNLVFL